MQEQNKYPPSQAVVYYPPGSTVDAQGVQHDNRSLAQTILHAWYDGKGICMPKDFTLVCPGDKTELQALCRKLLTFKLDGPRDLNPPFMRLESRRLTETEYMALCMLLGMDPRDGLNWGA